MFVFTCKIIIIIETVTNFRKEKKKVHKNVSWVLDFNVPSTAKGHLRMKH